MDTRQREGVFSVRGRVRTLAAALVLATGLLWVGWVGLAWSRCRLVAPTPTVQLRDRHGEFLGEVGAPADERLGFWAVDPLPTRVVAATLALEDRRFADHPGVDPFAIARAVRQNRAAGQRVSGASTLAMQVARLQDPGPRTLPRKLTEALTAVLLVDRYGRDAVLRQYLTLAPYGNNVYGIGYAARRYFDKPVDDLSWAETALLAAIPQAPGSRNLLERDGRGRAVERARRILDQLLTDGVIDPVDHTTAVRELVTLRPIERPIRPASTLHPILALERRISADRTGWPPVVETSLDLALQGTVQTLLRNAVIGWEERGAGNAAAVVVDLATFQVLADVGSTDWNDAGRKGAIDYSRTLRYPGSTLKPFLYAWAVDRGVIDPGTVLDDLARGPDGIGNADGQFLGPLLPRVALANSRNVPAISLTRAVGLDETWSLLARLGLHDDTLPASHYGLGLAIGGMPVPLVDLARGWGALATDGRVRELQWTADAVRPAGETVFSPQVAAWAALALSDPMARMPTFPRMGYGEVPFAAAFKTGTSPDHRDAWTVAFTDRYLVVVWVGHPDWRPMDGLSGYRAASGLARKILLTLHPNEADGLSDLGFPAPDGWVAARVCPLSGKLAGPHCSGTFEEQFPPDRVPATVCEVHRFEEGHVVLDLPARYSAWRTAAGLQGTAIAGAADAPVHLDLLSPTDGVKVAADPESPQSTLRLAVAVEPAVPSVLWFVDGEPFAVAEPPYEVRWPLSPGRHTFEARLPYRPERSAVATVVAR